MAEGKIEIKVVNTNEIKLHRRLVENFDVAGELKYDLTIACMEKTLKPGSIINSLITLSNTGHYDKDIGLRWWVEDPSANIINEASTVVALEPGESKNIVKMANIPVDAITGTYYFNAGNVCFNWRHCYTWQYNICHNGIC